MAYETLDRMTFEYTKPPVGTIETIDPTEIYLAKPGKRVIGKLNGIDEDSCHLEINLQNTSVLEFTVRRILDGEITTFYDLIDQHYELLAKGFGWFKINEEPELNNDGDFETKTVRAESLEIELQQFDLVDFDINTGEVWSKEMLAKDNQYVIVDDYKGPRDNVKFYRDTTEWDILIEEFPVDGTVEDLMALLQQPGNQFLYDSWRIQFNLDEFDNALRQAIAYYQEAGLYVTVENLKSFIGKVDNQQTAFSLVKGYPKLLEYLTTTDIDLSYTDEYGEEQTGTPYEILIRERDRLKGLSFLDLVLAETGWSVGFVDPSYNASSEDPAEREKLADRIGYFQVDTQDVYSFLTQEAAQYFRCVLDFNTEDYTVNAYKIETLGKDTSIYLSFHNIQNSVTRTSDRQFHTVYHVSNGTGDDNTDIKEANFGRDAIEDISYFLNTKHFPQSLLDKYNAWQQFKESKRQEYMDLAVDYRNQNEIVQEIYSRVPVDSTNHDQYSSFTIEELANEKENVLAEKRGYEAMHVDEQGEFDIDDLMNSRDWPAYQAITEFVLSNPLDTLMVMEPDDTVYEAILEANDLKYNVKTYQDELRRLQNELDATDPTDTEKIADLQEQIATVNTDIQNTESEISTQEATISAYYEDHKYEGIIDDDTIRSVMMYSLYANHLGYIDTELQNRWLSNYVSVGEVIRKLEFDEDYLYNFDRYGDLYGVAELEIQLKRLNDAVELEKQYAGKADQSDEYHQKHYDLYLKYLDAYNSCKTALDERKQEYEDAQAELQRISNEMLDLSLSVEKENYVGENGEYFTERELWLLQRYYIHTDYVNENIVVTDIFTNKQIVETEYDLYKDALEELFADSHPQWQFSTTQDNLLLMPELKGWHGELEVGNFIRVGFREDDPYHIYTNSLDNQVKLRLTSIGLNPFMIEPTIDLTFSSMIQYKSRRNDFVEIIGSAAGGSGKNQISSSYRSSSGGDTINISPDFIARLLNSSSFASGIAGAVVGSSGFNTAVGGVVTDALNNMDISVSQISDLTRKMNDLVNGYVDANVISTKVLYADQAQIDSLKTKLVDAESITAGLVNADSGDFDELTAGSAFVERLLTVGEAGITQIAENSITTENVVASLVSAQSGDFDDLTANTAFIQYLNSGVIDAGTVTADTIIAGLASVTPEQMDKFNVLANSAFIDYLETNMIVASEIKVDDLKAKLAQVDTITAGSAFANYLQALSSTVATSVIDDAYIYNAVAGNITVADLDAHSATADQIVLISQDGDPSIAFSGSTQQFYDSDGNVRVQIGQDGNGNFNFIVKGSDGTTALFDENGITRSGIPDNTIINNMLEDETIEKSKLAFPIVETNSDGTINITNIKDGSGGNFGVEYSTFKQNTDDAINEINSQKMYRVVIQSNNGNIFKNGDINCTLSCKVYSWDDDITDTINAANFTWTRQSKDPAADAVWNANHSGGTKVLTITSSDVYGRSVFYCNVTLPDGSIATGS